MTDVKESMELRDDILSLCADYAFPDIMTALVYAIAEHLRDKPEHGIDLLCCQLREILGHSAES